MIGVSEDGVLALPVRSDKSRCDWKGNPGGLLILGVYGANGLCYTAGTMKRPDYRRVNGKNSLMTIPEVAQYLHVSRRQVYRMVAAKLLPVALLGPRMMRVPKIA